MTVGKFEKVHLKRKQFQKQNKYNMNNRNKISTR